MLYHDNSIFDYAQELVIEVGFSMSLPFTQLPIIQPIYTQQSTLKPVQNHVDTEMYGYVDRSHIVCYAHTQNTVNH